MHGNLWKVAALAVVGGCASSPPPGDAVAVSFPGGASAPYDSAWSGYRAFNPAEPLLDWRAVNDTVREAGGHLGLMRSARPGSEPAKPGAEPTKPGGDRGGHGAHVPSAPKEAPK